MNVRRTIRMIFVGSCAASALGIWSSCSGPGDQVAFAQERRSSDRRTVEQGVEFLTRGPVHEAFAEPVIFEAEGGFVVSAAPPDPIDEMPPDQGPADAEWIPGYWDWDEARSEFLWVSGIWRVMPPGMDWVPGYWARSRDGFYWVSGFWKSIETTEVTYLPEPPATVDEGPVGEPPSPDHIWVSGNWMWRSNRYVWRPGYYVVAQPGWIWSPAHYVWTPPGYVFVDGFWDFSIRRRGILFAPVYFERPVYSGFVLTPTVVIDVDIFVEHLFIHPRHRHYYFGDYYDYVGAGIYPWFEFHLGHRGYDPIFAYYNWHYSRHDRRWVNRLRDDFRFRREHRDARPPSRFSDIERLAERGSRKDRSLMLATSIDKFTSRKDTPFKFTKLDESRREEIKERSTKLREFSETRVKVEKDHAEKGALKSKQAVKAELPKSPLASAKPQQDSGKDKDKAPPEKPKAPDLDESKEPKSRGDTKGRSDRQRDRDGNKSDKSKEREKPERGKGELGERAKPDQPKARDESRDKAKPDQAKPKTDQPKEKAKPEDSKPRTQDQREKAQPSQPKPGADSTRDRDRVRPQERARPEPAPRGETSQERTRPDRPKAEDSRDRSRPDREQAAPRAEPSPDRSRQDRPRAEEPRDRSRPDRPKAQEPQERTRPDRPRPEEPRDRPRQDRPKSEEPRERTRPDRAPEQDRQARAESNRPRAEPSREQPRPERPKAEPRPEQRKERPAAAERPRSERPRETDKQDRPKQDSKERKNPEKEDKRDKPI